MSARHGYERGRPGWQMWANVSTPVPPLRKLDRLSDLRQVYYLFIRSCEATSLHTHTHTTVFQSLPPYFVPIVGPLSPHRPCALPFGIGVFLCSPQAFRTEQGVVLAHLQS